MSIVVAVVRITAASYPEQAYKPAPGRPLSCFLLVPFGYLIVKSDMEIKWVFFFTISYKTEELRFSL